MKKQSLFAVAVAATLAVGWAFQATAQAPPMPVNQPKQDLRYQFVAHAYTMNGSDQEVYLKLDCYTGKTWRFHASDPRWIAIPEPSDGHLPEASEQCRYELMTHDYFDTFAVEQELILRVDRVGGYAWTYRGSDGTWQDVPQDVDSGP
jgi:hypothetical protein